MVTDTLARTKKLVFPVIQKYLVDASYPPQFGIPDGFKKEADLFWKINKVYPERKGKYIRPTLVLLTAEALGIKTSLAIKTAAAMQLSEEWLLIHDDVEDKSDMRRGAPSLHKIYGQELAINAGDSLHIIMWKMIWDTGLPKIGDEFYRMLLRTALGQSAEEMWVISKKKVIKDDEYFFISDGKSAYYSVAGPMRLGAILSGATKDQIDKITNFGLNLGRCFQLVDDIIDFEDDKKSGKITLATAKGIEHAKKLAIEAKNEAGRIFDKDLGFLSHEPARTQLAELTNFILERKY